MKKSYFVVIDMQEDFVRGSLSNPDAEAAIPNIIRELESNKYTDVLFTLDTHYDNYLETQEGRKLPIEHCKRGTEGWRVVKEFNEYVDYSVNTFTKDTFGTIDWGKYISSDVGSITLCGTCTDICVVSNGLILKALYPELEINVIEDCCAGLTPEKHKSAIDVMESCQINIL